METGTQMKIEEEISKEQALAMKAGAVKDLRRELQQIEMHNMYSAMLPLEEIRLNYVLGQIASLKVSLMLLAASHARNIAK